MPAQRRISEAQLETLVSWMENHPLIARGTQQGSLQGKQQMLRLWGELTSVMNATGSGVTKNVNGWRVYWSDLKGKVRRKRTAITVHAHGTGGGPSLATSLTPIEERILALMGVQNVLGDPSVRIPLDMGLADEINPEPLVPPPLPSDPAGTPTLSPTTHPTDVAGSTPKTSRRRKRKHEATRARPTQLPPPKWAIDMENRRLEEALLLRQIEERRLAIEERRLKVEERLMYGIETLVRFMSQPPLLLPSPSFSTSTPPPPPVSPLSQHSEPPSSPPH